jgi:LysM repeat protein
MKIIQFGILLSLLLSFTFQSFSQQVKDDEIVLIKGEKYVLHQVRTGETIFSISRNYLVDSAELVQNNPNLTEGLKIGDILQIPYRENVQKKQQPVYQKGDPTGFDYHPISSRKETPYFIAKKYGITVEELYAYNPGYNTLKKGDQLRIPRWDAKPAVATEETVPEKKPEVTPNYQGFLEHTVLPGETVYSISKKYHVTESEILFYNPDAKTLKSGTQIYLPAVKTEQPVLSVNENQPVAYYFEHIIESGETLWGISRKYGVSEEELKSLNPSLASGFPLGRVKIPVGTMQQKMATPVNEDAFIRHPVQKGETLYGIAAKYNLTIPDLKKFNPSLENRNLVNGETILIPRTPEPGFAGNTEEPNQEPVKIADDYYKIEHSKIIPEACKPLQTGWLANETFTVALFLPLYIEANDNINKQIIFTEPDTASPVQGNSEILVEEVKPEDMFKGFHGNSENYLQFYEGVLLAVDSLKKSGMNIRLNVYDTEDNPQKVRKIMHDESFLQTDLIIGPVSPKEQKEVAPIASKNRIPMVSPLVSQSDDVRSNSYYSR